MWTHYEDDEAMHSTVGSPDPRRLFRLLLLSEASELSAEIEGLKGTRTWDVSQMFATEVQANLEHCANYVVGYIQPPPPPNYVPLVGLDGWSGHVRYSSNLEDDGTVSSRTVTEPTSGGEHRGADYAGALNIHCNNSQHLGINIESLPPQKAKEFSVTLTIDDEELPAQNWGVGTHYWSDDEGVSWMSAPDHRSLYRLLRNASTLSVEIKGIKGTRSWDLSRTFTTPAQNNLDECGNYVEGVSREPVWDYVPFVNVSETTESGIEYGAYVQDDGNVRSYLVSDQESADGTSFRFTVDCGGGGHIGVNFNSPPRLDVESVNVSASIDGAAATTIRWGYHQWDNGQTLYAKNSHTLVEALRNASSITLELEEHNFEPITFDLTGMFDTPVQENIDNCGMYKAGETRELPQPEGDYVPVIGRGDSSGNVNYNAFVQEEGTPGVFSLVDQRLPNEAAWNGHLIFRIACWASSSRGVQLEHLPATEANEVTVTLQIDDQEAVTETWDSRSYGHAEGWGAITSRQPEQLIERLRGATTLIITIVDSGLPPITINVPAMFDTPIQGNIDNCGMYKRGETSDLPPAAQEMSVGQYQGGGPRTLPSTRLDATYPWVDGGRTLGLFMWCGSSGVTLTLSGTWIDGLSGETVLVEWSLDGGAVQSGDWPITVNTNGSKNLSPSDARAIIAAWRNGSQLDLTIPGAEPIVQQFDLAAIFSQSLAPDFDQCLAVSLAELDLAGHQCRPHRGWSARLPGGAAPRQRLAVLLCLAGSCRATMPQSGPGTVPPCSCRAVSTDSGRRFTVWVWTARSRLTGTPCRSATAWTAALSASKPGMSRRGVSGTSSRRRTTRRSTTRSMAPTP